VAHQLKGALGNFHARAAVHTAQQLETVGRQGELRNAESLFATLDHDLEVLSNVLKCLLQELESRARVDH
jgi:HPt (histidine-containing phosphotransfer) domain-containing protein